MPKFISSQELDELFNDAQSNGLPVDEVMQDLVNRGHTIEGFNDTKAVEGNLRSKYPSLPELMASGFISGTRRAIPGRDIVQEAKIGRARKGDEPGLGLLTKPLERVDELLEEGSTRAQESIATGIRGEQGPVESALQVGAGALGTAARVAVTPIEGLLKGVGYVIPESVKSGVMTDPLVQASVQKIGETIQAFEQLKQENPRLGRNLQAVIDAGEAALTFWGLQKAPEVAGKTAVNIGKERAKKALASIDDYIDEGISKGVKPTVRGKKTLARSQQFKEKSRQAVKSIVNRKNSLELTDEAGETLVGTTPENLLQFSESIDQAKRRVFTEWKSQLDEASRGGLLIDMEDVASQLDEIASQKKFLVARPQAAEHAKKIADRIRRSGPLSPEELDETIKEWNRSLASFYAGAGDKAVGEIEGSVAKVARKKLDDFVEDVTKKAGFQDLKNEYGALRSLEDEVAKRAIVEARRSAKGFFDITDVFTGGELVSGILTGNASQIIKGAAGRGLKEWIKFINNPNRIIKKMFQQVDNALTLAQ